MDTHIYLYAVLGISIILLVSSILYYIANKISAIPYTVLLLLTGIGLNSFHFEFLEAVRLTPGSVLFIFLPILLFESAFNFDFREFRRILAPGFLLASAGLLLSALIIALPLTYLFDIDFLSAFMFGSVISSTDPIAVLSMFKKLGVPKRLQLLVDGESFLNDGTSVIMFRILAPLATGGLIAANNIELVTFQGSFFANAVSILINSLLSFGFVLLGGVFVGGTIGFLFAEAISRIKNMPLVEITLTIISAHLMFIAAEDLLHVSGIIAVLAGGLVLGNYGRTKISPAVHHQMHQMWDLLVFIATSIVFLLIGYEIRPATLIESLDIIIVFVFALLIARAVSVYLMGGIFNLFSPKSKISLPWLHIANWGGLRGALPLIVLISIPETYEYRTLFIDLTLGAVLFTLIVNALTIEPLIKYFKLDRLNTANEIELLLTELFVYKFMQKRLHTMLHLQEISEDTYDKAVEKVELKIEHLRMRLESHEIEDKKQYHAELELVLRKYCLNFEKSLYFNLFKKNLIPDSIYTLLNESLTLQNEAIDEGKEQFFNTGDTTSLYDIKVGSRAIKLPFFEKMVSRFKFINTEDRDLKVLHYIYHEARLLGDEAVIEELNELKEDGFIPKNIMHNVLLFYKHLQSYNENTLKEITKENPDIVRKIEEKFVNLEFEEVVREVVTELGEQGRISIKALQALNVRFS